MDGEGETIKVMPTIQAVIWSQLKSAIGGNALAQRDFVNRFENAEVQRRNEVADACDFWQDHRVKLRRVITQAREILVGVRQK